MRLRNPSSLSRRKLPLMGNDEYGFQPEQDRSWPPGLPSARVERLDGEDEPGDAEPAEAKSEPDFSDTAVWVCVERDEVIEFREPDGDGRPEIVRHVLSGRKERSYRHRRPEDGDAVTVYESPNWPARPEPEKFTWQTRAEKVEEARFGRRGVSGAERLRQSQSRGRFAGGGREVASWV